MANRRSKSWYISRLVRANGIVRDEVVNVEGGGSSALTFTAIFRTLIGLVPAALLAIPFFGVSILKIGTPLIFLLITLYIFGVTLGLLVTSGLIRFGPSFENIAWASLFFLAPLGCIYYPIEILPNWLRFVF